MTLAGEGFVDASSQPANTPYLTGQLLPKGTLLDAYAPIAASALAEDAELLSGQSEPQETHLQAPGCAGAGAQPACTPGSAGELASDDAYLQQTLPAIMASPAYRGHGLIVIVFAAGSASTSGASSTSASGASPTGASGVSPTGASGASPTGPLGASPPGALLLSPFLRSTASSTTPFHPAAPRQDLQRLFKSTPTAAG